jgi:hypothetical protein
VQQRQNIPAPAAAKKEEKRQGPTAQQENKQKENQKLNPLSILTGGKPNKDRTSSPGTANQSSSDIDKRPTGGGGGGASNPQKAKEIAQKAKDLIRSSTEGEISNPDRLKKLLDKLKDSGTKKQVQSVKDLKSKILKGGTTVPTTETTTGGTTPARPTNTGTPRGTGAPTGGAGPAAGAGPTGEPAGAAGGKFDFEAQAEELLSGFDEKFLDDRGLGQSNFLEDRDTAAANFNTDVQRFLDEFRSDQDRRQQDYLALLSDEAAKASEFDPEKFRSTLLELESSRRRQKDWNERSARQAYKY